MTKDQESAIWDMVGEGYGYRRIAKLIGLPESTVRSHIKRRKLALETSVGVYCLNCMKPIFSQPHHRQRKFCSDECRMDWWNAHREKVNHKSGQYLTCPVCKNEFHVYGTKQRVYCSRECRSNAVREGN